MGALAAEQHLLSEFSKSGLQGEARGVQESGAAQSLSQGRPTKRDRRDLDQLSDGKVRGDWNARWSASLDD